MSKHQVKANNLMEKLDSALRQWIVSYTHYFNFQFSIFIQFTNQITLQQSQA